MLALLRSLRGFMFPRRTLRLNGLHGQKPILRAHIKEQNAKSKTVESRRAGMEFKDGVHGTPYAFLRAPHP